MAKAKVVEMIFNGCTDKETGEVFSHKHDGEVYDVGYASIRGNKEAPSFKLPSEQVIGLPVGSLLLVEFTGKQAFPSGNALFVPADGFKIKEIKEAPSKQPVDLSEYL